MAHTAATGIKYNGKLIPEGSKVDKKDFDDATWDSLLESGAIEKGGKDEAEGKPEEK